MSSKRITFPRAFAVTIPMLMMISTVSWADPARDSLLADYAVQAKNADPVFAGFSAERGRVLYTTKHTNAAKPEMTSCQACHGEDPRKPGQGVKTGKTIDPMAVSTNSKRFTNRDDVEKWFGRNCRDVLARECTALEKGDYITFLSAQ